MRKRANGEGSVYYNASRARWEAVAPWPSKLTRTGKTQAEAIRRRDEAMSRAGNIAHVSAKQPLRDYLTSWLATKAADVSARTYDGYAVIFSKHVVPVIGDIRLCDVKPQHIQRVLDVAKSAWTRAKVHQRLKAALELAVKWDIIARNPVDKVDAPAVRYPPVSPLTEAHFYKLLRAIRGDRLEALWLLMLAIGCRRGEAIALDRSSIDLDAGTVSIVRSLQRVRRKLEFLPAKTPKSNRSPSLPGPVIKVLRAHLVRQKVERLKAGELWEDRGLLFCSRTGAPLEPRNVSKRWHQILKDAGIPPKSLKDGTRHTAISILLRDGADVYAVQAMAGHASPTTTLEIYGHLLSSPNVTADKMAAVLKRRK